MASPPAVVGSSVIVLMFGSLTPNDLQKHFSQFGEITQIHPYFEPNSTHKYGTFVTFTSISAATASERQENIEGVRVQVYPWRRPVPDLPASTDVVPSPQRPTTVKISMFYGQLSEDQLAQLFSQFGTLSSKPRVIQGNPVYSYINFTDPDHAKVACEKVCTMKKYSGVKIKVRLFESKTPRNPSSKATGCAPQQATAGGGDYPATWQQQSNNVSLFNVTQSSQEWDDVYRQFLTTMTPRTRVHSIQRIQNKELWEEYAHRKMKMLEKGKQANEKKLFHGSGTTPSNVVYESDHGFDFRHSGDGFWGQGAYFAVNAGYSNAYSYKTNGSREMIMATVLTGNACQMGTTQNRSLRQPPCLPGSRERYDSVKGRSGDSDVYIVYEFYVAYPEYLISYSTS